MWKTNSLRVQNNNILHFFFEFLIDEIKNTSMKARKSLETGLNLKFVLGGFLSNYLVNESECYEQFKMAFSIFLQIFKWNGFLGKQETLREKCPNMEFYLSVFSRTGAEYGDLRNKSPYSAQVLENTDQKKLRIWTLCTQWKSVQNCYNQKLVIGNLKPFFRKARQRIQNCSKENYFKKLF